MKDAPVSNSQIFEYNKSTGFAKRSLAEELRMHREQREHKERMSIEKFNQKYLNALNEKQTPLEIRKAARADNFIRRSAVPIQSDNSGTMYRIRPQTPKLNLLTKKLPQQKQNLNAVRLESIDKRHTSKARAYLASTQQQQHNQAVNLQSETEQSPPRPKHGSPSPTKVLAVSSSPQTRQIKTNATSKGLKIQMMNSKEDKASSKTRY